jgi:hypothetical protein
MRTLTIREPSAWGFVTSSTGGAGIAFVAADGGRIYSGTRERTISRSDSGRRVLVGRRA